MRKSALSGAFLALSLSSASFPSLALTYYYWVDTALNKVVRGTTPPSGSQTYTSSSAASVYLTYYWVDKVSNTVNSGDKTAIPKGVSAFRTYADAAKRVLVFWIDPKTMRVKYAYVGRQPLTVTQTYSTLAQAEGELPAYWVNRSTKQVLSGKRKDVPATEMYYSSSAGAQEYLRMGGHTTVNLSPAYRLGATGNGVKVAVVDSGVDASHVELRGRVDTRSGWDYVLGRKPQTNYNADPNGHGTHVAGTIAGNGNNAGFSGVAPLAQVVNFRILPASGSGAVPDSWLVNIVDRGLAAGVKIYSNSWGDGRTVTDVGSGAISLGSSQRYKNAVLNSGAVFVWANGNEGKTQASWRAGLPQLMPELNNGGWVAVASLDPTTKSIASYSNRCGTAAAWCLTAPGSSITSAKSGGGETVKSGTSMATPYVSGSIALLQSYFTTLSSQDVVKRLFVTADRSGIYADSSTYGQGVMDVGAAAQPIGGLWLPTGASTTSSVVPLSSGVLSLNGSMLSAAKVVEKLAGKEIVAVDGFSRATFKIPSSQILSVIKNEQASAPTGVAQGVRSAAVGSGVTAAPKLGLTAEYFGQPSATGGSMMMSWSGPSYSLMGATDVPLALVDKSALADGGLGVADVMRGFDPLSERLGRGASIASNFSDGTKVFASSYGDAQSGSGWRFGVERSFSAVKVGLEGGIGALSSDWSLAQVDGTKSSSLGAYAVAPLASGAQLMAGVSRGFSSSSTGAGALTLEGHSKTIGLSLGLKKELDHASFGVAARAQKMDASKYTARLPVSVADSGEIAYQSFTVSRAGSWKGSVGAFYSGDISRTSKAMISVTRDSQQTKAWAEIKTSF